MRIIEEKNNTIILGVEDFDLCQTLECGQCFHFYKQAEEDYVVIAFGRLLHIRQMGNDLHFLETSREDVEKVWINYFDLDRDYGKIKRELLAMDDKLKEAMDKEYGVRILNQEFYETLISFIISQNKQIPHIKAIVKTLSDNYGTYVGTVNGEDFYSFPSVEKLMEISEEDYRACKAGFRAPYLRDASIKLNDGTLELGKISSIDYEAAKEMLIGVKGVGEKVANCVLLFSLGHRNAFPIDVWIKRVMEYVYFGEDTPKEKIAALAREKFGDYGGYAQQYLFYFARSGNLK